MNSFSEKLTSKRILPAFMPAGTNPLPTFTSSSSGRSEFEVSGGSSEAAARLSEHLQPWGRAGVVWRFGA